MSITTTIREGRFKEYSAKLFVLGGALMLVAISLSILGNQTWVSSPDWIHNVLGPFGVVCTAYGLVTFYPWVADAAPRFARAALVVAAVGAGTISVAFVSAMGAAVLTAATVTTPPPWVPPLYFTTIASLGIGFLLYGIASVRTRVPSRTIGLTMLVPAGMWAALFVGETVLDLHVHLPRVVFIVTPIVLMGIGYTVQVGTGDRDPTESPGESIV